MEILWICGSPIVGGAERVSLQLAQLLGGRGHRVQVLSLPRTALAEPLARAGLQALPAPLGGWRARRAIGAAFEALRPDLALVTTSGQWPAACLAHNPARRTALVLVRHMALPLPWIVRRLANRRADAIIAVSEAVRRSLLGRAAISPRRVHMIHNPVRFAPRAAPPSPDERARARAALRLPAGGRWVGFFGGLDQRKGIADVLSAVRRANATVGPTSLLICGNGSAKPRGEAARLADPPGLEGRVHYLGHTERVAEAMTAADAVVVATHAALGEGCPLTPLEAMACGTPVLAYATGGIPEVLGDDGSAGRLAPPDDADRLAALLAEMLADEPAADRIAHAALRRVRERFDPQAAAERYQRLFAALIESRR